MRNILSILSLILPFLVGSTIVIPTKKAIAGDMDHCMNLARAQYKYCRATPVGFASKQTCINARSYQFQECGKRFGSGWKIAPFDDTCRWIGDHCNCGNTGWGGVCNTGPHKKGTYCRCD